MIAIPEWTAPSWVKAYQSAHWKHIHLGTWPFSQDVGTSHIRVRFWSKAAIVGLGRHVS